MEIVWDIRLVCANFTTLRKICTDCCKNFRNVFPRQKTAGREPWAAAAVSTAAGVDSWKRWLRLM
jgi:hypothetical protein